MTTYWLIREYTEEERREMKLPADFLTAICQNEESCQSSPPPSSPPCCTSTTSHGTEPDSPKTHSHSSPQKSMNSKTSSPGPSSPKYKTCTSPVSQRPSSPGPTTQLISTEESPAVNDINNISHGVNKCI